ncbi:ATP-binding cassette domain-containing protein [Candidatus Falkowbacteria bacterium]|nr:ATP-binding cassette domain-containing protein [Candidatus Falkowbacteria bacterium]
MPIIEIKNLTKQYNGLTAVDSLNLEVQEGEIFCLLGPNGAGKTTTLMMLTTLVKPTSGTATVGGFDIVKNQGDVRRSIGIVFQDPSSDEILTGYENLKLHGMLYGMSPKLREERIKEVLELVELTERKDDLVKKYSGGMRRRLEMARGLMHHPKILFLDEPTLGLDPQSREHIWKYVNNLVRKEKISVIITTHYMDEADMLCDRLAIIDHGKIAAMDSPAKLKMIVGGDVVVMKTANPNLEGIKKLEFVKKIQAKDGIVSLTVENASEHLPQILETIGKVESVEVHLPTLDDVFLHYTGKAIRETSAEGGWAEKLMAFRAKK